MSIACLNALSAPFRLIPKIQNSGHSDFFLLLLWNVMTRDSLFMTAGVSLLIFARMEHDSNIEAYLYLLVSFSLSLLMSLFLSLPLSQGFLQCLSFSLAMSFSLYITRHKHGVCVSLSLCLSFSLSVFPLSQSLALSLSVSFSLSESFLSLSHSVPLSRFLCNVLQCLSQSLSLSVSLFPLSVSFLSLPDSLSFSLSVSQFLLSRSFSQSLFLCLSFPLSQAHKENTVMRGLSYDDGDRSRGLRRILFLRLCVAPLYSFSRPTSLCTMHYVVYSIEYTYVDTL